MKSTFLTKLRSVFKRDHFRNQKGLGTIEMVVLLAVLVVLAFSFKQFATSFFKTQVNNVNQIESNDTGFGIVDTDE